MTANKHTLAVTDWQGKWVVDFNAFSYADSEEEARALFERLEAAAEDILCGLPDDHDQCPRMWTAGGQIMPEQTFEEKSRDEAVDRRGHPRQ